MTEDWWIEGLEYVSLAIGNLRISTNLRTSLSYVDDRHVIYSGEQLADHFSATERRLAGAFHVKL